MESKFKFMLQWSLNSVYITIRVHHTTMKSELKFTLQQSLNSVYITVRVHQDTMKSELKFTLQGSLNSVHITVRVHQAANEGWTKGYAIMKAEVSLHYCKSAQSYNEV